ncbi:MAG: branched-chain amino acid ABC transporter permease [Oscillospiraceae bacterium]|nr:branched-chain amino acid ABC transporter permease [Oscillospiraceae bacterium]
MKKISKTTRSNLITYAMVVAAFVIMQILSVTGHVSNSLAGQLVPICVYICMAVSLNLTVGILGELSLGHAGFMSVGAFTGVVVAMSIQSAPGPVRLILAIVIGGIMAGIAGVIVGVPVLRLRGDYLAIVTLAFGEIIKNLLNNIYVGVDSHGLHFSMKDTASLNLDNGTILINGPMGAPGIEKLSTFVAGFILVLIVLTVTLNLIRSRSGRAIMAIRDNRIAAESVGINITKYKLMAFVTSAVLAGMSGALYAMNYSSILPKKFDFNTSILVLVFVVLGGMGNIRGSIIAATVLTILPEALRALNDYRMLIYAVVLILVMLVTNNPILKNGWTLVKEKLAFWRKKTPETAAEGGGVHEQ